MNQNDQLLAIDNYDIIDLMGLGGMDQGQKQRLLLDINDMVWSSFITERLNFIFTSDQIGEIKEKMDSGAELTELLEYMNSVSSNFNDLLVEYTRIFKIGYIRKHHQMVIEDFDREMKDLNGEERDRLSLMREKNVRALGCVDDCLWDEVIKIFKSKE